jgi:hypothetical protein
VPKWGGGVQSGNFRELHEIRFKLGCPFGEERFICVSKESLAGKWLKELIVARANLFVEVV